ncbi:MAG: hypothetical protein ACREUQ_15285 [Burkholderiales bacterium]
MPVVIMIVSLCFVALPARSAQVSDARLLDSEHDAANWLTYDRD